MTGAARWGWALAAGLVLSSWFLTVGKPLLSSHCDRQMQTADTAKIFTQEGWNPLRPKLRVFGKPGICLLEFPLYQTLVAGLSSGLRVSVPTAGRFLSVLSWIALCAAVLVGARVPSNRPLLFGFALSAPEVFGVSQWVTIELFNAALAAWAFLLFARLISSPTRQSVGLIIAWAALMVASAMTKPTALFAIWPLFAYVLWWERRTSPVPREVYRRHFIVSAAVFVVTAAALVGWSVYAERMNDAFHAGYRALGDTRHLMFNPEVMGPRGVLKILGRILSYILGPGTLMVLGFALVTSFGHLRERFRQERALLIACALCAFCYVLIFFGANYFHNYYQIPLFFPLFVAVLLLLKEMRGPLFAGVAVIAILMNAGFGQKRLATNDSDWTKALPFLVAQIPGGFEKPELLVATNSPVATPATTFYTDRYIRSAPVASETLEAATAFEDALWVCDSAIDSTCRVTFGKAACRQSAEFGRLWLCVMHHDGAAR